MATEIAKDGPEEPNLREITLQLDNYDDIFSDFDPRPYTQRELSEDFLKEVQRRYMEGRHRRFEVRFTLPSSARDFKSEVLIKKRIREHFAFMHKEKEKEIGNMLIRGYVYVLAGAAVLFANVYALFALEERSWAYQLISVMLVPAGWYGMFTGIGKIIDEPLGLVENRKLYEKFCKADYIFISEEKE